MEFNIAADLHIGSPIEMHEEAIMQATPGEETILLGDIIDMANCEKGAVLKYRQMMDTLRLRHGARYLCGNHERKTLVNELYIHGKVLFAHGDIEADPDRWHEYRGKTQGAGWFKRTFIIPFIREAEQIIERKPKEDFLKRASALAKEHGCETYVCGHFHPQEIINSFYDGVRIIIVPRGITRIDL